MNTPSSNMKRLTLATAAAAAALFAASTPARAADTGPSTREQVRQELMQARIDGTLSLNGEAGDTEQVLAARERANQRMADRIVARQLEEQQRQQSQAQLEQQGEMALMELALAEAMSETAVESSPLPTAADTDKAAEPSVEVVVLTPRQERQLDSETLVIVSVPTQVNGTALSEAAAAERARYWVQAVKEHGVPAHNIYVEGRADA